jgi:hypothetical protein
MPQTEFASANRAAFLGQLSTSIAEINQPISGSWTPQQRETTAAPVYSSPPRTSGAPPANNFPRSLPA